MSDNGTRNSPGFWGHRWAGLCPLAGPRVVFLVFLLIYLLTMGGHYTSGDGAQKVAWAKALLFEGTNDLDPGPGVKYCKFGIGHTLLAMPSLAVAHGVARLTGVRCEGVLYCLVFVVNGATFLWVVARYLWPHYAPARVWATVLVLGLATTWWPYTKLDFSEPLVLTFWFAGFLLVRSGWIFWGLCSAMFAVAIRQDALLLTGLLAVWQVWRRRRWRDVGLMVLGALPAGLLIAGMNYVRYHSWTEAGYAGEPFNNPLLAGLYGLLLSPGKGVLLFSPPLLAGLLAWKRFQQTRQGSEDAILFAAVFVVQLLVYAKWWCWSGDDNWGVRYLIPGVMLMAIPLVEFTDRKWTLGMLAWIGVGVQLLAVLFSGLDFVLMLHETPAVKPSDPWHSPPAQVSLDDFRYHPRYNQLVGHWLLLRTWLGQPPARQAPNMNYTIGPALYDALPETLWQRYAHLDFVWLQGRRLAIPSKPATPSTQP